jgi:hypothetical protein
VLLDCFPDTPATKIIENLTFRILYFVPLKQVNPHCSTKSRNVDHIPKNKWRCAWVDMSREELWDYGYTLCYESQVNQIALFFVRKRDNVGSGSLTYIGYHVIR